MTSEAFGYFWPNDEPEPIAQAVADERSWRSRLVESSMLSNVSVDKTVDKGGTLIRARCHRPSRYGLVNF